MAPIMFEFSRVWRRRNHDSGPSYGEIECLYTGLLVDGQSELW